MVTLHAFPKIIALLWFHFLLAALISPKDGTVKRNLTK